jgi:hypothetical protein
LAYEHNIFSSINDIPESYWADLKCKHNIYFRPEFLHSYEIANRDISFGYIFILKKGKAIALAYTQLITISIKTITKNTRMLSWFRELIDSIFCRSPLRVLFCGNVFLSGEYGVFLKKEADKTEAFNAIADAIKSLSHNTKRLHALFIKDFEQDSLHITDQLHRFDYASMNVEPNMIIDLKPQWQSFDDYKKALKSKYRIKANKADSKSEKLNVKLLTEDDIKTNLESLQNLYQNTIDNADFNAQILNLQTYIHLKSTFKERFIVKGYFLDGRLVGFLSAMHNNLNLDAHFIGIDYALNKSYAIYPRILNDYIRLGIEVGAHKINIGRTASEIKSTLGALPQQLTCYCRHKRYLPNLILKPFIANVQIKTYKQHQPFK